jgi:signal transduction histidine kinase
VRITYGADDVGVEVTDSGGGARWGARADGSGGRGLAGMRQRVESCGGRLLVAAPDDGGFAVAARFPAPGPATVECADGAAR